MQFAILTQEHLYDDESGSGLSKGYVRGGREERARELPDVPLGLLAFIFDCFCRETIIPYRRRPVSMSAAVGRDEVTAANVITVRNALISRTTMRQL